ncbi:hypothetical protein GCM10027596_36540 [Nocardioides korecus]
MGPGCCGSPSPRVALELVAASGTAMLMLSRSTTYHFVIGTTYQGWLGTGRTTARPVGTARPTVVDITPRRTESKRTVATKTTRRAGLANTVADRDLGGASGRGSRTSMWIDPCQQVRTGSRVSTGRLRTITRSPRDG